jgi:hypothetical protein
MCPSRANGSGFYLSDGAETSGARCRAARANVRNGFGGEASFSEREDWVFETPREPC